MIILCFAHSREDMEFLFDGRNLPETIKSTLSQKQVTRKEHEEWFERVKDRDNHLSFVCWQNAQRLGHIRFDRVNGVVEISIWLLPEFHNKSIGPIVLKEGLANLDVLWKYEKLIAKVYVHNPKSLRFFIRNEFAVVKYVPYVDGWGNHVGYYLMEHRPGIWGRVI